ncbi:MAG: hypothetical protein ACREFP_13490 [Acetobacteraceae bacterium]
MILLILRRTLAICSATLFVAAFALAALEPPELLLGSFLSSLDSRFLNLLQTDIQGHLSPWIWDNLILPILFRPAWLLPAAGGLICAGGAATLTFAVSSRSPHRWRG